MAFVRKTIGYITILDAAKRKATVEVYLNAANAEGFATAANIAAADATLVGDLFTKIAAFTGGTVIEKGTRMAFIDNAAVPPVATSGFLRGNKVVVQFAGSGRNFVFSIPARKAPADLPISGDGVTLNIAGILLDLQTAFGAVGTDLNGDVNAAITGAYLND